MTNLLKILFLWLAYFVFIFNLIKYGVFLIFIFKIKRKVIFFVVSFIKLYLGIMVKIKNPYLAVDGYNCFGCSPYNHDGLKMNFMEEGNEVICKCVGWKNILHGGIQATLMDEIAGWVVSVKVKTAGVTSRLNVRYLKAVEVGLGDIIIKGKLIEMRRNIALIQTQLFDGENNLCAEADIQYFTFNAETASLKYNYPGHDSFYE